MNRVIIDGRLARDSEVKETSAGPVTKLRMVHNKWSKSKGEVANFFSVEIWKEMHIPKGTAVLVDGELDEYSYDKDGEKRSFINIKAYKITPIQFVKLGQAPQDTGNVQTAQKVFGSPDQDDNIPF